MTAPWLAGLAQTVGHSLRDEAPPDVSAGRGDLIRRRIAAIVTLVIGTALLGISLSIRPGSTVFYPVTLAVALTWVAGALLSGPLPLGYLGSGEARRRPIVEPILLGVLAGAIFVLGALIVREISPLHDYVENVLAHLRKGSLLAVAVVTLVSGVAEEMFFRGCLYAALAHVHPVLITTAVYTLATVATGNPMLVFAALTLGFVLGLQRRASGGVLAPALTHVTWSAIMLFALPPLFVR